MADPKNKPSIEELERMMDEKGQGKIRLNPDGGIEGIPRIGLYSGRASGKTSEMHRLLGKHIHAQCKARGKKDAVIATAHGNYRVRVTKMRKPKGGKIEFKSI